MIKRGSLLVYAYFILFFLSGIAGLIYESIWSHYLKQFLGHAAYSQTLVLVIYMGGMALGSWLAGERTRKIHNLLKAYAIVEIVLGVLALVFHDLFLAYLDFSFQKAIPFLDKPILITLYKWITASAIIFPQSVLLGATFPLMAGGILRRFPGLSGYKISFIYFINTLGASLGVLLSGFYLTKHWGLKGAIVTGGLFDIVVGIGVYLLCLKQNSASEEPKAAQDSANEEAAFIIPSLEDKRNYYYPMLILSAGTAAASFIYEIGWIRMLSLVLGSSTHSFELMLSAFIMGLALGSFFVRNRLDKIQNIPRFLGVVQIIMGASALMTLFTYGNMFEFMAFILGGLKESTQGYLFFNLLSHLICLIMMLPSTICAGMVIPLIIHLLYKRGFGEEAIGKVYAVNTFGGIVGIIIAVWALMPVVGLKFLITIGGVIDMGLGLMVLSYFAETRYSLLNTFMRPVTILLVLITVAFSQVDPSMISSGVFRYGQVSHKKRVIAHKDGRTASITLFKSGDNLVLSTNGKPDASLGMTEEYSTDEYTMAMLGVIPLSVKPQISNVAIIGMGSGMTAHYVLYDPNLDSMDIVEIEPAMAKFAKKIGEKVSNTFTDNRCKINIEDAKTFFSARNQKYDLIISEPSNPWVSGVSNLFSTEFFSLAKRYLNDDGIMVQWFHKYESDISVLVSILKAVSGAFPKYEMYATGSDLIVIASMNKDADLSLKRDVFTIDNLAKSLGKMGFVSMDDIKMLKYADQNFFNILLDCYDFPVNSDYHSFVDLYAVKYRYLGTNVKEMDDLRTFVIPLKKLALKDTAFQSLNPYRNLPDIYNLADYQNAKLLFNQMDESQNVTEVIKEAASAPVFILDYAYSSPNRIVYSQVQSAIIQILQKTLPYLSASEMREIWDVIEQKISRFTFTDQEKQWISYFRSLCYYDMPAIRQLSVELLPEDSISDHYSNQMLLASLFMASANLKDTSGLDRIWRKYELRDKPPVVLMMGRALAGITETYSSD